jgi:NDP-sugar pyrophosphorylase family protein
VGDAGVRDEHVHVAELGDRGCDGVRVRDVGLEDNVLAGQPAREPLERLATDGQLRAYRHTGFWDCMDTYKDMLLLNDIWSEGGAPWKLWA